VKREKGQREYKEYNIEKSFVFVGGGGSGGKEWFFGLFWGLSPFVFFLVGVFVSDKKRREIKRINQTKQNSSSSLPVLFQVKSTTISLSLILYFFPFFFIPWGHVLLLHLSFLF
jgi:hypothetical protein